MKNAFIWSKDTYGGYFLSFKGLDKVRRMPFQVSKVTSIDDEVYYIIKIDEEGWYSIYTNANYPNGVISKNLESLQDTAVMLCIEYLLSKNE